NEITGSGQVLGSEVAPAPDPSTAAAARPASPPVSHFPLERDPDEPEGDGYLRVPGPPRMPTVARTSSADSALPEPSSSNFGRPTRAAPEPSSADRPVPRVEEAESQTGTHKGHVATLVARVAEALGSALDGEIDNALHERAAKMLDEQIAALKRDGAIGPNASHERLVRDARAELCALGPLGALLADD